MNREEIIQQLKALPYDPGEYWVIGEAAKVLQGLEKGAGNIWLSCLRKTADRLEAEGYRKEDMGSEKHRHFKLSGKICVTEDYFLNMAEDVDGFRVLCREALEFSEWMDLKYYGLDPDTMKKTRSAHYVFHYQEGSLAEREIQHITEIQEQCFRGICDALKTEPDFPIHYFLLSSPEEVGYIGFGGGRCNGYCQPPEKVFVTYNETLKSYGAHEVAHLISRLAGHPDSVAVEEGLALYFDGNWWGVDLPAWVLYYMDKGKYLKFGDLLENEYFREQPSPVTYPIVGSFTRWLILNFGMEKYLEFYGFRDSAEGFRQVYGKEAEKLDELFVETITRWKLGEEGAEKIEEALRWSGGWA